jgi:hypothetical protein
MALLANLGLHDRSRADWPKERWRLLLADYFDDLAGYHEWQVDLGVRWWRRNGKPWFPTVAELIAAIETARREWLHG